MSLDWAVLDIGLDIVDCSSHMVYDLVDGVVGIKVLLLNLFVFWVVGLWTHLHVDFKDIDDHHDYL